MAARMLRSSLALSLMLSAAVPAQADPPLKLTEATFMEVDAALRSAQGRPNELSRLEGHKAFLRQDYATAISQFERAAYHADKFSQHSLSLMYWHGVGVEPDAVQAYIWADLAAERGSTSLLLIREKMWAGLTPGQQAQAVAKGAQFYARYGDSVAKARGEGAMRRFADGMTGSRVGHEGRKLEIMGPPAGGVYGQQVGGSTSMYQNSQVATGEQLYGGDRRDMAAYWAGQDRVLDGTVEVGKVQPVRRTVEQ